MYYYYYLLLFASLSVLVTFDSRDRFSINQSINQFVALNYQPSFRGAPPSAWGPTRCAKSVYRERIAALRDRATRLNQVTAAWESNRKPLDHPDYCTLEKYRIESVHVLNHVDT